MQSNKTNSSLDWKDISSEEYRTYIFPNNEKVTIDKPKTISISKNGHKIFDSEGLSHYIPYGWIHLHWKGDPPFAF